MGCLNVKVSRVGSGIKVNTHRIGEGLKVNVGLICTVGTTKPYVRVNPDVVWVSPEIIRQLLVESNTQWRIE